MIDRAIDGPVDATAGVLAIPAYAHPAPPTAAPRIQHYAMDCAS